jgi:Common central domain of tyrosinase/FG-GAP-like repeat
MGRRQDLNALPAGERQALVNLILQYLNDAVVAAHITITHAGEHIFTGHRRYIEELEAFLAAQGAGRFVPLPAWNPTNPIPPEFNVVKPQDNGTPRPALVNLNPNLPMPSQFAPPAVCNFTSATLLGNAVNSPWHNSLHGAVGGTMSDFATASAAPIFWCWHGFVDEIYWDYHNQCAIRVGLGLIVYGWDGAQMMTKWGTSDIGQGAGALSWLVADVDGDGKDELLQTWKNGSQLGLIVYGWDGAQMMTKWGTSDIGQGAGALSWLVADVDGDGKDELLQPW